MICIVLPPAQKQWTTTRSLRLLLKPRRTKRSSFSEWSDKGSTYTLPQDFGAAYNCLRRRSYSPWGPTKNQIIVFAFSIPTARQSRSTLAEKIGSVAWTFLNLSEGWWGFSAQSWCASLILS